MATGARQIGWIQRLSPETKAEIVLKTAAVSIVSVPVEQKMSTHERSYLLVLFRVSFFCPNVAFFSMSKQARSHGGAIRGRASPILLFLCTPTLLCPEKFVLNI